MKPNELKTLVKEVNLWRKSKTCENAKVPDQLASAIRKLGKNYNPGQIANLLSMSNSTVRKLLKVGQKKTEFIEMPTLIPVLSPFSCTLQRADGAKLIIELKTEQVADFIPIFLCSS